MKAKLYHFHGEELTLREISERSGVKISTLSERIKNQGMTAEQAAEKKAKGVPLYEYCGRMLKMAEIAEIVHIPADTIRARMRRYDISVQDAVDDDYEPRKYFYEGTWLTERQLAARAGVETGALCSILRKQKVSAEEAVEIARNGCEAEKGKPRGGETKAREDEWRDIAERLIAQIVNNPKVICRGNGIYGIQTRLYDIEVAFEGNAKARLAVRWRKTDDVSMIRKYRISNGGYAQIEAVSF